MNEYIIHTFKIPQLINVKFCKTPITLPFPLYKVFPDNCFLSFQDLELVNGHLLDSEA